MQRSKPQLAAAEVELARAKDAAARELHDHAVDAYNQGRKAGKALKEELDRLTGEYRELEQEHRIASLAYNSVANGIAQHEASKPDPVKDDCTEEDDKLWALKLVSMQGELGRRLSEGFGTWGQVIAAQAGSHPYCECRGTGEVHTEKS